MPPDPARRRRALFRALHRGTKEADRLVGGYVEAHVGALTDTELDALEQVLELPDVDLEPWLSGRAAIPPGAPPLIRRMRDFVRGSHPS